MSNFPYLFKLSLAIGQSLDLKKNCENFLTELNEAKGLSFASVWIKEKSLNSDSSSTQVNMVCAVSDGNVLTKNVFTEEVNFRNFGNDGFFIMPARDIEYAGLFSVADLNNCSSVVFPLGETGFLQMLMTVEKTGLFGKKTELFKKDELADFFQVINSFTLSLKNCIDHLSLNQNPENKSLKSFSLFSDRKTVATMNHEIRNPMNAILGFSELLAETELSKKQTEFLEVVKTSSKHLFNVLNEVLDYSKILARQFSLENTSFDVNDLIRVLVNSNKTEAGKSNIELKYSVNKMITEPMFGDKHKLLHALQYLVDNAIKFTSNGVVEIKCELLSAGAEFYNLAFSVEDSGIGIEEKNLKKICKSFTQEDDSITRKFGGLGLGLSISRYIIQAMGGELKVQSSKGNGSIFSFTLELKIDRNAIPKNEQSILQLDKNKTGSIKVLLVDDDPYQRNLGGECLANWNLTTANNGEEAVNILKNDNSFDVVLMDIRMPVMDGIEATRIIRKTLMLKMPIIAVSGEVLDGTINECTEAGMNSFVSKPFKREDLLNRMVLNLEKFDLYNPENAENEFSRLTGKRALVVEDNKINQMVTRRQLKNLDCEVDVIDDGNLVLSKLQSNNYDFVLMDLYMSEMGGFEATREIRKNGINTPVIAFSGDDSIETIESCTAAGMNGLIVKPCESAEMASKINTIIFNSQTPKIEESKLVDLSFLRKIFVNNPGKIKSSIRDFIVQASPVPEQLNLLFAANNFDLLWKKAHFIKSSVLSLGIKSLKVELVEIVSISKKLAEKEIVSENDKRELHQRIQNFETILKEAITLLKKEID
jgi:CheY-like chemotaxis protein